LQPDNVEKKAQEIKKIWNINDGGEFVPVRGS